MATELHMPALTAGMTEGSLKRWLKAEGEAVTAGEVLAEIESDKAVMEFESPQAGILGPILVPAGSPAVAVNTVLALLLAEGEIVPDALPTRPPVSVENQLGEAPPSGTPFQQEQPSAMRVTIARRLSQAKREIPHYYLTVDCRMEALEGLRVHLNTEAEVPLTLNDLLVKACALALQAVPTLNAAWVDGEIHRFQRVDLAVAVALDEGLVTPVLRDVDRLDLTALHRGLWSLMRRARAGKLTPDDYRGGGFTLTNLGSFGVREFAAIINPPHAGILALGAVEERPVVDNGAVTVGSVMSCVLSADHRLVDGAVAARFLSVFRQLVEEPPRLLL